MPVNLAFALLFYLKLAQHRQRIIFEFGNQKRGFCNVANGVSSVRKRFIFDDVPATAWPLH